MSSDEKTTGWLRAGVVACRLRGALAAALLAISPVTAQAAKKIAFVVGIDKYDNLGPDRQLLRAVNDARAVAKAFNAIGFDTSVAEDVTRGAFNAQWQAFLDAITAGDSVAVYFSAHGMEIEGLNYLLPRDIPFMSYGRQEQLKRESISVAELLLDLRKRGPQLTLLVLDACRDNPLIPPEYRSSAPQGGLARMDAPEGTFIMYAAGAGQTALDRLPGRDPDSVNSVYTRKLIPLLGAAGLTLPELARQLRFEVHEVAANIGHTQTPAYYDGLMGRYCLAGCNENNGAGLGEPEREGAENLAWGKADGADRLEGYRAYLAAWPQGRYASQATIRVSELERLSALWEGLRTSKNLPGLRSFIALASGSEFAQPASLRLKELEALESVAWQTAETRAHLADYDAFLAAWPQGFFALEAQGKLNELQAIKGEWDQLRRSTDEQMLVEFVHRHGWSEFGAEATAQLIALRREHAQPDGDGIKVLSANDLAKLVDGKFVHLKDAQEVLSFSINAMPDYRMRLGTHFLKQVINEELAAEGAFEARFAGTANPTKLEGLGGIVRSKVDGIGSLFLLQMHGDEKDRRDVDKHDRQFRTLQVVQDAFGYVCIATGWQPILENRRPTKVPERCTIDSK